MIQGWFQIALTLLTVILITPLLGKYIANVFLKERTFLDSILGKLDRLIYKAIGLRNRPDLSGVFALGFLLFTSAATGLSVGIAFIRGLTGRSLGNFYEDLVLSITRILLPISIVGGVILIATGVPETIAGALQATGLEGAAQIIASANNGSGFEGLGDSTTCRSQSPPC